MRKAFIKRTRQAPVHPNRLAGQVFQKAPVMGNQDNGTAQGFQLPFQPFNRRQVQMVCRLVEHEDIRLRGQRPGQGRAARFTAGQNRRVFFPGQAQRVEQVRHAIFIIGPFKAGNDIITDCIKL